MKKQILRITFTTAIALASISALAQENKQAANARKELHEAKIDSAEDFNRFKKQAEATIKDNKQKIKALKSKKSDASKEEKENYDKKVKALEEKNENLKSKIQVSSKTTTEKWVAFKKEFNHDIEELGKAIRDIAKDSTK
jgi:hypothetical protein